MKTTYKYDYSALISLAYVGEQVDAAFKEFWWSIKDKAKTSEENRKKLVLSSKIILTIIWRCEELGLEAPQELLKLDLSRDKHLTQFKLLPSWKKEKLIPYMTKAQISKYIY